MKHLKTIFSVTLVTLISLVSVAFVAPLVSADAKSAVCKGAGLVAGTDGCEDPSGNTPDVNDTVRRGLNLFSAILGIIAVVMIMIGGLKYMTSQGDSSQMNSARNTLIFAAVGLVIVVLAQVVVRFVLQRFA